MSSYETHKDSEPLITGTHRGTNGSTSLYDPTAGFLTAGIDGDLSQAIYNDTQVTNGNVTSSTDTNVESDITWNDGDTYSIYKTSTKDSTLSRIGIDRSRGWKVFSEKELNLDGWFPDDADIDKDRRGNTLPKEKRPMSPGSPADNKLKRRVQRTVDSSRRSKRRKHRSR